MVFLFCTTYIGVELAHHDIFRAKVGKGSINSDNHFCVYINYAHTITNKHLLNFWYNTLVFILFG